jgi:hypothetical protein
MFLECRRALTPTWSPDTLTYRPILLGYQSSKGYTLAGMAVVLCESDTVFRQPTVVASELARKLLSETEASSSAAHV